MYTNSLPNSPYRRIAPTTSPQTPINDAYLTPAKPRTLSPLTPSKLNGADLSVTLSELRNQLQSKELTYLQKIKELEEDLKLVSEKYYELVEDPDHQKFLSVIDQLQIKISQQHDDLKMRDDRIDDLQRLVDDQGTRIENLEAKLREQTLLVIQKYEEFLSSSKTYAKAITEKDKIIENLTERLNNITKHKEDSDRIVQSEIEQLKLQIKIKDRQIEAVSMQFESSKVEYDESLHYFEDMTHSSQRNFDTLSKRMNEQMEEILLKDKQVEELNSRVKQLLTQAYTAKNMYEDSVQALNVELASKTKQVTIYQNQIEVMKIEAAQKQSEFELALNQERHKLDVKKVANLEREKNEYKEENKSLYEKLKERETQSQLLAVKVDSVELQKDNMAKQLDELRREVSQLRDELKQKDELLVVYNQNNSQLQSEVKDLRQSITEVKQEHNVHASPMHVPEEPVLPEEAVIQTPTATGVIMDRLIDRQTELLDDGAKAVDQTSTTLTEEVQQEVVPVTHAEVHIEAPSSPTIDSQPSVENVDPSNEGEDNQQGAKEDLPDLVEVTKSEPKTNGHISDDDKNDSESLSESDSSDESMSSESQEEPKEATLANNNSSAVASSSTGAAAKTPTKVEPKIPPMKSVIAVAKNSPKKGPSKLCGLFLLVLWLLVSSIALVVLKPDLVSSVIDVQATTETLSTVYSTVYNYVKSYM
jgi:hypothetical protein